MLQTLHELSHRLTCCSHLLPRQTRGTAVLKFWKLKRACRAGISLSLAQGPQYHSWPHFQDIPQSFLSLTSVQPGNIVLVVKSGLPGLGALRVWFIQPVVQPIVAHLLFQKIVDEAGSRVQFRLVVSSTSLVVYTQGYIVFAAFENSVPVCWEFRSAHQQQQQRRGTQTHTRT